MPLQNLKMQPDRLTSSQKYVIEKSIIKFFYRGSSLSVIALISLVIGKANVPYKTLADSTAPVWYYI